MKSIHSAVISAIKNSSSASSTNLPPTQNDSIVTFDDNASATSGRIGDYLANKRARKNVKALTILNYTITPSNVAAPLASISTVKLSMKERKIGCKLGLDSHADISCVGKHARILEYIEGQSFTVKPFNDAYSPMKNVRMVNAALALDTDDGMTVILHINQCLDFSDTMTDSILCTNQARMNKVVVDDVPLSVHPTGNGTHSVFFPKDNICLPLLVLNGPVSYLQTRCPTDWDLDHSVYLHLTDGEGPWDPELLKGDRISALSYMSDNLYSADMRDTFTVSNMDSVSVNGIKNLGSRKTLSPEHLSRIWNITLKDAKRTIRATTQHAIRTNEGIKSKRLRTMPRQQLYKQISNTCTGKFASDTFLSNVTSLRGNKCVQLFTNRANFSKSYPMPARSSAPKALDRFLHEIGVPPELLTDNAPELVEGEWAKLCRRHNIKQKFTEPYSPWQNPAELEGGIIKRKIRRLMKLTLTPIRLWDYAWDYVSSIRALTDMRHPIRKGMWLYPECDGIYSLLVV